MMSPLVLYCALSAIVNAATSFVLGLYVIATNRRSWASRTFFGFAMSVGFWSFCYTFWQISTQADHALFWLRGLMMGAIFIPTFFIHFVITLLGLNSTKHRLVQFSYLVSTVFVLSNLSPLFISGVEPRDGFRFWAIPGVFFHPYLLHFTSAVIYAHYLMFQELKITSGSRRNQIKYVSLGTLLGFAGGASNFPLWYNIPIPPIGNALVALYVALTAFSIARFRLLDINLVLSRMAVFSVVYVPLLILPVILGRLFQPALVSFAGQMWWVVPTVLEAAFAVGGLVAFKYVQERAENRILAEQRKYQSLLVYAAEGMLKILDLQKLLRLITWIIVRHVKLSFAALYLQSEEGTYQLRASSGQGVELPQALESNDPLIFYLGASQSSVVVEELKRSVQEDQSKRFSQASNRLARMKAGVAVPSFLKNRLLGFLILGEKLSGQMFTTSDIKTFDTLSHEVAIAISNARFHRRTVDVGRLEAAAELVTALSHEFGNVFHSLTIQVGTLAASLDSDNAIPKDILKQASKRLEATAIRGRTIINDVGSFRKQSEKHGIQTFPLAPLIQDAVKTMQTRFESRSDIKVKLELPNDLPTVQGFATLPTLPLSLLADSFWALEQIPEGGEISVSVRVDRNQEQAEIRVTDPGKSLRSIMESPDPMEKAELFPERSKHSGVYVFLTRKITNDHHGTLTVMDGSENSGTAVIVRLPLAYKAETIVEEGIEDILGENAS